MTLAKAYQNTTPRPPGMSRGMYFANYMFGPSQGSNNNMVYLMDTLGPSSQARFGATAAGRRLYGGGSPLRGGFGGGFGSPFGFVGGYRDPNLKSGINFRNGASDFTGAIWQAGDAIMAGTRVLGGLGGMIGAGKAIGQMLGFGGSQIPMGMYPSGGDNFHLQPRMAYPQAPAYSYGQGAMGAAPAAQRYSDAGGPPKVIKGIDSTGPAAQALHAYVKDQDGMHLERTNDGVTIHFDNDDAAFAFGTYYSSHLKDLVKKEKASNPSGAGSEAAANDISAEQLAAVDTFYNDTISDSDSDSEKKFRDELDELLKSGISNSEKSKIKRLILERVNDDTYTLEQANALLKGLEIDEIPEKK